ncbi:amino acid--[acyl-carrier-protein] ligase [Tsukamurella strandjordii]|uniref:Amino acid--[acyl-carrier-protein] ligase n=1 Tax=Tsukamurella strandjordii TaxID=147577 RepID=A0AA90NBQ8_9ACTN|nr:amino acid--[acyl-carrier-protein] ligase [Tsukamurella strandjordii]MDP0398823.1 amino acid--[acyl-carrier-protein] ligase [Tsukamurella strandjordii]
MSSLDEARRRFRDDLIAHDWLVPTGMDGLYGRSEQFEAVVAKIDARVSTEAAAAFATRPRTLRFPPVFPSETLDRTDYVASFPDLAGSVHSFDGGDPAHRALLADREEGLGWERHLSPSGVALVSAACQPAYPTLTGTLPSEGALLDVYGYCFRREPAIDPLRMQAFRAHDYVRVGDAAQAVEHADEWIRRATAVLSDLGLDVRPETANDPFFGRAGRMLKANQLDQALKTELVIPLYGPDNPATAVASCNNHQDHFGQRFDILQSDGAPAHSSCVGFGIERIVLAMVRTHGVTPSWV